MYNQTKVYENVPIVKILFIQSVPLKNPTHYIIES